MRTLFAVPLCALLCLPAAAQLDEGSGPAPVGGSAKAAAPKADPKAAVETVFKAYAACYGLDWRVLKAVAKAESGLDPYKDTGSKADNYKGLFQLDSAACGDNLKEYDGLLDCGDLHDPEANTAAAAHRFNALLGRIKKACGDAILKDVRSVLMMMYVGHNNGPAVLKYILEQKLCEAKDPTGAAPEGQEKAVRENYLREDITQEGKLLKSYREDAKPFCRTGGKKPGDDCYVHIAKACQGRRQLDLYERGEPDKVALKAECAPKEGDSEVALVRRYKTIDEGWGAEKWWVGSKIAKNALSYGATEAASDSFKDKALCPRDLKARVFAKDKLTETFPEGAKY